MEMIPVKIAKMDSALGLPLPEYQTDGASGMDLLSVEDVQIEKGKTAVVHTGIKMIVPKGYEIQIRSRGGLASKGIFVTNGPGTVDSDYRGELMVLLTNLSSNSIPFKIRRGDRVAQMVVAPVVIAKLKEVYEFEIDDEVTDRGEGRFASTGGVKLDG